jgi:hypothetical protein
MNIKKKQLSALIRSAILMFTTMILLQSLERPRMPLPMIRSALPLYHYPVISPISQRANPFCSMPACARKAPPAHCPCNSQREGLISGYAKIMSNDLHCQWRQNSDRLTYRFVNFENLKKKFKRIVKRLLHRR